MTINRTRKATRQNMIDLRQLFLEAYATMQNVEARCRSKHELSVSLSLVSLLTDAELGELVLAMRTIQRNLYTVTSRAEMQLNLEDMNERRTSDGAADSKRQ